MSNRNLRITGQHRIIPEPHVGVENDASETGVQIVVTQAYGPRGDNLVGISDVAFEGHPAVTLGVRGGGQEGLVHLSPIHGDSRKQGLELAAGTVCELFCPVSGQTLDLVGDVEDGSGAKYYALYLTPQLSNGSMVMVSNVWGHYHSRIVDNFELISAWADQFDEANA
jgi:hypothetical protein